GGAAIGLSDRRLKYNIHHVGYLNNGIPTYVFSFLGSKLREFGVMADEVINILPDAVIANDNGYMMVDYRKVYNG
ncbi:MAG TPA: tail fiber domain-containing protein, partial [Ktedonobacteraceae bacterium]|nr:tail fiber domain-containing protein [Ktedonobacteraceae bacterium]